MIWRGMDLLKIRREVTELAEATEAKAKRDGEDPDEALAKLMLKLEESTEETAKKLKLKK